MKFEKFPTHKELAKCVFSVRVKQTIKTDLDRMRSYAKQKGYKFNFSKIVEFSVSDTDEENYKVWDTISIDVLEGDVKVTVEWISKWKWFTWAMKKHNFHGWPAGHGSKFHRALGSIGNRKPTRTHRGKKMHGHHGNTKFTIRKVPVELVNKEINVIGVRWGVPGGRNSLVNIIF